LSTRIVLWYLTFWVYLVTTMPPTHVQDLPPRRAWKSLLLYPRLPVGEPLPLPSDCSPSGRWLATHCGFGRRLQQEQSLRAGEPSPNPLEDSLLFQRRMPPCFRYHSRRRNVGPTIPTCRRLIPSRFSPQQARGTAALFLGCAPGRRHRYARWRRSHV
jgi:hypothetical protein